MTLPSSSTSAPSTPRPPARSGGPLNPGRVWADFVVYARSYMRSPEAVFFTLLFPFILVLMFGAIFSGSTAPSSVPLYVQNQDSTNATTLAFYHALSETGLVTLHNVSASVGNMSLYMSQHSYSNGLVIPPGFGEEVWNLTKGHQSGAPVPVRIYINPFDQTSAGIVEQAVQLALTHFNQQGPPVAYALPPSAVSSQSFQPKTIDYEVPGLIGFAILMNPMFAMVNVTAEYKKEKLFKALSLTPLTKGEWLLSKILWNWAMTFLSAAILFATGVAVYGAHVIVGPLILPFLILGPLFFASLGMLIGTLSKKAETAGIIGNLFAFPMMFLSGAFIPVSVMPGWLQPYARVWPLYYVIDGIQAVSVFSNTAQALFDLALITIMAALSFVAAVLLFRWREE
ncbi:MAG: ABC transporter permease [Euryarchaeota archaeon]|nr:ABC transporter permease [Euryarchaeota archaeon]MDE1835989.1 ABC transporter permease [Euryarchaeota archaeon]MDE1880969.1 ABC transporter permease [Euryarchaeota archaeon]MDE2046019.1 ABC transporter permease [Thermoplasmata archaeon]